MMKTQGLQPVSRLLRFGNQPVTETVLARGSIVFRQTAAGRQKLPRSTCLALCAKGFPEELSNEISHSVHLAVGGQPDVAGYGPASACRQSTARCHGAEQLAVLVIFFNLFEPEGDRKSTRLNSRHLGISY